MEKLKQRLFSYHALSHLTLAFFWVLISTTLFYSGNWPELFRQLQISPLWIILPGLLWIGLGAQDVSWNFHPAKSERLSTQEWVVELFALLIPLVLFWVLCSHIPGHWWKYDDLDILHYIDVIGPTAGFYDPDLKYNFYTPLQHFSLGIDYLLFGLAHLAIIGTTCCRCPW